jgi:hypothetical protein
VLLKLPKYLFFVALALALGLLALDAPAAEYVRGDYGTMASEKIGSLADAVGKLEGGVQTSMGAIVSNLLGIASALFVLGVGISLMWSGFQFLLSGGSDIGELMGNLALKLVVWGLVGAFIMGSNPPAAQAIAGAAGGVSSGWVVRSAGSVADQAASGGNFTIAVSATGLIDQWGDLVKKMVQRVEFVTAPAPVVEPPTPPNEDIATRAAKGLLSVTDWFYDACLSICVWIAAFVAFLALSKGIWDLILNQLGAQFQLLIGGAVGSLYMAGASTDWTKQYARTWVNFLVSIFFKLMLIYIACGLASVFLAKSLDAFVPPPVQSLADADFATATSIAFTAVGGFLSFGLFAFVVTTVLLMVPSLFDDVLSGTVGGNSGLQSASKSAAQSLKGAVQTAGVVAGVAAALTVGAAAGAVGSVSALAAKSAETPPEPNRESPPSA